MSVLIETTLGEIVIDVFTDDAPLAATNFLKLCKIKYFHGALFFNVQENFMVQTGDPTGTGAGGTSLYGQLYGAQANFFADEIRPHLKHNKKGLVGMANSGPNTNASQFYITTRGDDLEYLDGKHTLFGEVAEGWDVLAKINELYVDKDNRPFQDVRIKHTHVLDDPFPDPPLLVVPPASPQRERPELETVEPRLAADEALDDDGADGRTDAEIEQSLRAKEAKSRAVVLEMIGDLPDADVKPPDDVLFVCKLNPVTESSDLDMAFCRFGPCKSEVIRDYKTGDSLCFAFVEFTDARHCEEAYFKMNNVLLDDRRIKVDFSQSVSKLWNRFARREAHSARDGDPYDAKRAGGGNSTRDKLFGKGRGGGGRGGGAPLHLKASKRVDEFELVDEHDDGSRSAARARGSTSGRVRERRRGDDADDGASRRRERSPESVRAQDRSHPRRSRSRDRDDRSRVRAHRARSPSAERRERRHRRSHSRDRRDAKRSRSRSRGRERERERESRNSKHR